jgi:pimeloyl-ACP methyl ester carboxylesterase
MLFTIKKEQWDALKDRFGNNLLKQCPLDNCHVVVLFSGWTAPWQDGGGKPIPLNHASTVAKIRREIVASYPINNLYALATEAYATDTDDDAKILALNFIKSNRRGKGRIIVYGYSWGGDTAVELVNDLNGDNMSIPLLVTIDAALGPFNGPAVRDRMIPENVLVNINHYTTTPKSSVFSQGLPNAAKNPEKTLVVNIKHSGPSHGEMDEVTMPDSVSLIGSVLARFSED